MRKADTSVRPAWWSGLGLALMAAAQPAAAFGDAGPLTPCDSFTTCSAAVASGAAAIKNVVFTDIGSNYLLPAGAVPGVNSYTDFQLSQSATPAEASVGVLGVNQAQDARLASVSIARAQTSFGTNRALGLTSAGAMGGDTYGSGTDNTAGVEYVTVAEADSAWRDVWSFTSNGHFQASVLLDGTSRAPVDNPLWPSTYAHTLSGGQGDWFYDLMVWDVDHLSISEFFEAEPGPTLVASLQDRSGNNEQRISFASAPTLEFDFLAGTSYVVTSQLGVRTRNGRDIDLYNTARLSDATLSAGAMSTLSGHDYLLSPVPEPASLTLTLAGLLLLGWQRWGRRAVT